MNVFISFKAKEYQCHRQLQHSMLAHSAGGFGKDGDVTDGLHLMTYLEIEYAYAYSQYIRATK